jgi:hypothetical protein
VAVFNFNDRLVFYSNIMVNTHEVDETGHPIAHALVPDQITTMAMQGLSHALYTFWPDVIIFVSAFFTTAGLFKLIRQRRHKIVILHTESPYQDDEQLMRGGLADLNLLNDPANLAKFREIGPAEYMPHAYRPAVHYPRTGPRDKKKASDFCFIGTAFKSRVALFEALDLDGIDTLIAGADWGKLPADSPIAKHIASGVNTDADCVHNHEAAELYRHAKLSLNLYRREGEEAHADDPAEAMGPREVELAATGLCFLRDSRPEGDELLPMLPTFDGPGDASEKLRWWINHPKPRERAASLAREAVADRTFVNNAKRLLRMLESL